MSGHFARLNRSLDRLDAILQRLEYALDRREPDRDPLFEYLEDPAAAVVRPRISRWRSWAPSLPIKQAWQRSSSHTMRLAMPVSLGVILAATALLRLPAANTGWTEQLVVASNVGTGDFDCEPVKIAFVEATLAGGQTTFVYSLSGGGGTGPKCQDEAVSRVSVPVCFDAARKPLGDVLSETHPPAAAGAGAWNYSPIPGQPQATWTSTSAATAPGLEDPYDPLLARFSFTLQGEVTLAKVPAQASFRAGSEDFEGGLVKVPACPLPVPAAAPLKAEEPAPAAVLDEKEPAPDKGPVAPTEPEPYPEPDPEPSKPTTTGPVSIAPPLKGPAPRPTPKPTPVGVMVWR